MSDPIKAYARAVAEATRKYLYVTQTADVPMLDEHDLQAIIATVPAPDVQHPVGYPETVENIYDDAALNMARHQGRIDGWRVGCAQTEKILRAQYRRALDAAPDVQAQDIEAPGTQMMPQTIAEVEDLIDAAVTRERGFHDLQFEKFLYDTETAMVLAGRQDDAAGVRYALNAWRKVMSARSGARAGDCTKCGGPVQHRDGKPGEYDHECRSGAKGVS